MKIPPKKPIDQIHVELFITQGTHDAIEELVNTGLYGPTWRHAFEELLRRAVREALLRGEQHLGAP